MVLTLETFAAALSMATSSSSIAVAIRCCCSCCCCLCGPFLITSPLLSTNRSDIFTSNNGGGGDHHSFCRSVPPRLPHELQRQLLDIDDLNIGYGPMSTRLITRHGQMFHPENFLRDNLFLTAHGRLLQQYRLMFNEVQYCQFLSCNRSIC